MENTQIVIISILSGTTTYFLLQWLNERNYRKLDKALYELEKTRAEKSREFVEYIKENLVTPKDFDLETASCNRCDYSWTTRKEVIDVCPKCKSRYWNKPRVRDIKKKANKNERKQR